MTKDTTPKGWKIKPKHAPGAWIIRTGLGPDKEANEKYRNGYEKIFGKGKYDE